MMSKWHRPALGRANLPELLQLGEAYSNPSTILFVLALCPAVVELVGPVNARTQDAADIPWSRHRAFREHVDACRGHSARLAKLRARFRILAMLGPYLVDEPRAVRRFWFSICVGSLGHGLAHEGRRHVGALSVADGAGDRAAPSVADGAGGWPRSPDAPCFPAGPGATLPLPGGVAAARVAPPRLPPGAQLRLPWHTKNIPMLRPECKEAVSLITPGNAPLRHQRMPAAHPEFGLR